MCGVSTSMKLGFKSYILRNTLCPNMIHQIKIKMDFTYKKITTLYVLKYHCTDAVF